MALENEVILTIAEQNEITRFLSSPSGRRMIEWLESTIPDSDTIPIIGNVYPPEYLYHIRSGLVQGYKDALFNIREIPNLELNEKEQSNEE
jgi:hypothetical protein